MHRHICHLFVVLIHARVLFVRKCPISVSENTRVACKNQKASFARIVCGSRWILLAGLHGLHILDYLFFLDLHILDCILDSTFFMVKHDLEFASMFLCLESLRLGSGLGSAMGSHMLVLSCCSVPKESLVFASFGDAVVQGLHETSQAAP